MSLGAKLSWLIRRVLRPVYRAGNLLQKLSVEAEHISREDKGQAATL